MFSCSLPACVAANSSAYRLEILTSVSRSYASFGGQTPARSPSNSAKYQGAPERISELLRLRRDCLVEGDREYHGKLRLRWPGSKGFEDTTKWLPTEMVSIARQAVANLTRVTAPAQKLAAWYTANPTKLYLHDDVKHLRYQEIPTPAEIALLLWGDNKHSLTNISSGPKQKSQIYTRSCGSSCHIIK